MGIEEALEIVYDLAQQNALPMDGGAEVLLEEAKRQREALNVVHDFIVNVVSEGRL